MDRSGAYAARWVAKSLVKAGLCKRCLVQVAYAIAVIEPLSITIFSYGSSQKTESELLDIVKKNFDLRPGRIVKCVALFFTISVGVAYRFSFKRDLDLKKPIYTKTSCYGHFGREEFNWEKPKKLVF